MLIYLYLLKLNYLLVLSTVKKNIKKSKTIPSEFYYSKTKFKEMKESLFAKH